LNGGSKKKIFRLNEFAPIGFSKSSLLLVLALLVAPLYEQVCREPNQTYLQAFTTVEPKRFHKKWDTPAFLAVLVERVGIQCSMRKKRLAIIKQFLQCGVFLEWVYDSRITSAFWGNTSGS
jgi:hypothetical protein